MRQFNNLTKRILSAFILAPIALWIVYIGQSIYLFAVILLLLLCLREWIYLNFKGRHRSIPLSMTNFIFGLAYIIIGLLALYYIRNTPAMGHLFLYYVLIVVWTTDTAAYFTGRLIGGKKLWPQLSPRKTWAGSLGGVLFSLILGTMYVDQVQLYSLRNALWVTFILSVSCQCGDLLVSYFKRYYKVKDTAQMIPGHGGLLDRIDGLLMAAITLIIIVANYPIFT